MENWAEYTEEDRVEEFNCFLNILDNRVEYPEYTEEDRQKEHMMFLSVCGSCLNFASFMAESGFCRIAKNNCVCGNPKSIDMFDNKCEKWIEKLEF